MARNLPASASIPPPEEAYVRITQGVVGVFVGLVALAGCGGGSYSSPPPTGNPAGPTPPPADASVSIVINGDRGSQSFTPNPASVAQGRTIAWQNLDGVVHRIMSNDGSFDTGNISPGATSRLVTLTTDGTNYHCTIHPGMIGSVNSASGSPPPCTGIYC